VLPLIANLIARHWNWIHIAARSANLSSIEMVATTCCFVMDNLKVSGDGASGIACLSESKELRVVGVSASSALQHRLCEKPFSPYRDKAARVEISRMQRPQSHVSP
jgi:hypothetical protein